MQHRFTAPLTRTAALAASAALATVALTACSSDDDETPTAQTTTTSSAVPSVDPSKVSPTDLPSEPAMSDEQGAVADASFGTCAVAKGRQSVSGTLTSTAKKTRDYVVSVSWVNATSDVLARAVAVEKGVKAGEKREFSVSAQVPGKASTCTFRVLRGSVD